MSNRDTQFQGFAKLLISEMESTPVDEGVDPVQRIAQHIYDFACHVMDHTSEGMAASISVGRKEAEEWIENIPDLPKWIEPEEKQS